MLRIRMKEWRSGGWRSTRNEQEPLATRVGRGGRVAVRPPRCGFDPLVFALTSIIWNPALVEAAGSAVAEDFAHVGVSLYCDRTPHDAIVVEGLHASLHEVVKLRGQAGITASGQQNSVRWRERHRVSQNI